MNNGFRPGRLIAVLAVLILASFTTLGVVAAEPAHATIGLRIEGISDNIFYGELVVPYADELTAADVLLAADEQYEDLTIAGAADGYITDINGDASASFGGWDGWLFKVNGEDPDVGILDFLVADGDDLLIYYGDPYGAGMQFPEAGLSGLADGVIRFTSRDTTFDAEYNKIVTTNPVAGAVVTWYDGTQTATFTTDTNGEIAIPSLYLTPGMHKMQIAKPGSTLSDDQYLPLVLRFAPDFAVEILAPASSEESTPVISGVVSTDTNPQTGDQGNPAYFALAAVIAAALASAYTFGKQTEKEQR
ncbi:MAG: DUF4430 domain-containing protein [Saccharofermentanales bacterium]